jgi:hypothetical protein
MKCARCKQTTPGYFNITRFDAEGHDRGSVQVCSAVCLIQWGYEYSVRRGIQGAAAVHDLISNLRNALQGGKK